MLKKGGVIKSIYEVNSNFKIKKNERWIDCTDKELMNVFKKFESYGEQLRLIKTKIPNLVIFDRETVFLNINEKTEKKNNEADIIIRNKEYAETMSDMFERTWEKSYNLKEYFK